MAFMELHTNTSLCTLTEKEAMMDAGQLVAVKTNQLYHKLLHLTLRGLR